MSSGSNSERDPRRASRGASSATTAATGEFDPAGATVRFERRQPETGGVHIFADAAIGADGTFSLESPGGPASIQIADLPRGWTMKAIRLDDTQIGDHAVDFGEGAHRRVEIVVTNRSSGLSGTVADRRGKSISNASILVFPDNPAQWGVPSRQVREERSRNRRRVPDRRASTGRLFRGRRGCAPVQCVARS